MSIRYLGGVQDNKVAYCAGELPGMKRVQVAHRVYGIGPETAEIARVVRGITERRLAALREVS